MAPQPTNRQAVRPKVTFAHPPKKSSAAPPAQRDVAKAKTVNIKVESKVVDAKAKKRPGTLRNSIAGNLGMTVPGIGYAASARPSVQSGP